MTSVAATPESLCVIRLSAIGDCCHTLPVIRTLQAAFPDTPITWIVGKVERSLLEGVDGIEFITFDKSLGLSAPWIVRRELKGRQFPILLHMHASMRANLVSCAVNAQRRIGFDRSRARDRQWLFSNERIAAKPQQHVMDGLFGFAEHLGVSERVLRWDIPVSREDQNWAWEQCSGAERVLLISPCSSQRFRNFRNWSIENYCTLVKHAQDRHGARVLLTGADTELEQHYAKQIQKIAPEAVNLVGKTSLKRLLALIAQADLVLCPDSGPAHMAAATGTPVVGLYATSNRMRTGPYFSQPLVADRYPDAVATEFSKPIDSLRWGQRVRNPAAMELITVAEVRDKVDTVLGPAYSHAQPRTTLPILST